jgi:hypothetical protein
MKTILLALLLCVGALLSAEAQVLVPSNVPNQSWYLDHVATSADDSLLYRSGIGSWPVLRGTFFRVTTSGGTVVAVSVEPRTIDLPVAAVRAALALKPKNTTATLEQLLHDAVWRACADSLGIEADSLGWSARLQ